MKLQFTNGYRPRFEQISRILQYLLLQEERKKVPRPEIVAALGIPDKQIENVNSMMTGFGLVLPKVSLLTPLGKMIIQGDPYFEKNETLWIIHYIVSSNPEWVVWHRIVNDIIPTLDHISVDFVSNNYFSDLATQFSERSFTEKLPKEVGAVLAGYARSELARLNIVQEVVKGNFVRGTPIGISELAFLYCLLYFRERFSPGASAMNVSEICLAVDSPGRVFNLPEYQVRSILGELHSSGQIRMEQFANLDQVRVPDTITQESVLALIYRG